MAGRGGGEREPSDAAAPLPSGGGGKGAGTSPPQPPPPPPPPPRAPSAVGAAGGGKRAAGFVRGRAGRGFREGKGGGFREGKKGRGWRGTRWGLAAALPSWDVAARTLRSTTDRRGGWVASSQRIVCRARRKGVSCHGFVRSLFRFRDLALLSLNAFMFSPKLIFGGSGFPPCFQ